MPVWAVCIGLAALTGYAGFRLLRALRTGTTAYGPFQYGRDRDGLTFWFFTVMDGVFFAFLAVLLALVVRHQLFP